MKGSKHNNEPTVLILRFSSSLLDVVAPTPGRDVIGAHNFSTISICEHVDKLDRTTGSRDEKADGLIPMILLATLNLDVRSFPLNPEVNVNEIIKQKRMREMLVAMPWSELINLCGK